MAFNCLGKSRRKSATEQQKASKRIDKELVVINDITSKVQKLLLLGTGDSGKSTFQKQIMTFYTKDAQLPEYYQSYTPVLRSNCLTGIQTLLKFFHSVGLKLSHIETSENLDLIKNASQLTPKIAELIEKIWKVPEFRTITERGEAEVQIDGGAGASYYFENASRFAEPTYTPTFEDILKARRKTTGINELHFTIDQTKFQMIDVGGQRCERKKWINCFTDVSCIIFFGAINEYDLVLEEDSSANRLLESLKLWRVLSTNPYFKTIPFILFLNKSDLFREKIKLVPLNEIFKDFEQFSKTPEMINLSVYEQSWRYILLQYRVHFKGGSFFPHLTCAVDTENCKFIFQAVKDSLYAQPQELF